MIKPDVTVTEKHLRKGIGIFGTPVLWFQLWELMRERMMGDSRTKLKEKKIWYDMEIKYILKQGSTWSIRKQPVTFVTF